MNLARALNWGAEYLRSRDIDESRLEAELLLAHSLKIDKPKLISDQQRDLSQTELAAFTELIGRRSEHEPTAYITGVQPFLSLDLYVEPSVLIPRPETELLVENVLRSNVQSAKSILDVGTGSGAIAVSLAKHLPGANVVGIDTSEEALAIARKNAGRHRVTERCRFLRSDMFDNVEGVFDLIVSNPPYIPSSDMDGLQPEVRDWEPRAALDGGPDGLRYIRLLIEQTPAHLKPAGNLWFEFGFGQSRKIEEMLASNRNYKDIRIIKDYSGIDRIASAQLQHPR